MDIFNDHIGLFFDVIVKLSILAFIATSDAFLSQQVVHVPFRFSIEA